jgi:cystathionine gamma-synthase
MPEGPAAMGAAVMPDEDDLKDVAPATLAAQALGRLDPPHRGLVPPLYPATTYERAADNSYPAGCSYIRDNGPAYDQPEALLASLEGGEGALLFASGMAAASAVLQMLNPGDHLVAPDAMYYGVRKWLDRLALPKGVLVDYVPAGDLEAIRRAVRPGATRLVWVETPANPNWTVTDIAGAAALAHDAGALLVADSTVATPVLTRPLTLGADIVMHSATKYLNGHSDVLAGALVTRERDELHQTLREIRGRLGGVLGAFEAWLLLRGMRTLYLRVPRQAASALAVARHLETHPAVAEVLYPGLQRHPGHEIAVRQMTGGCGGMLSIRMGGEATAIGLAARLRLFKRATSLGGVESLIEHRASVEGPGSTTPSDLLRISIGIEDPVDLIRDLDQGLATQA